MTRKSRRSAAASKQDGFSGFRHAFRALASHNFRLYFFGQGLSLIGTWMTRVATGWLVYRLTDSPLLLGAVSFASQIPIFFLAPFAGVWIDRMDRRRMLVLTQILAMVQSLSLAAMVFSGHASMPAILGLSLFQGVINAFDIPGRQAFLLQIIERKEHLQSAIALNSSMVNGARLIGPSLAGFLIAFSGEAVCFLADGLSYAAVIASLLLMRGVKETAPRKKKNALGDLKDGWSYATGFAPIRTILLILAITSLTGMPYVALMPIMAGTVLHGGPNAMGFLMSSAGCGALIGALHLAGRKNVLGLGGVIAKRVALFGCGLVAFSLSRWLPLSMALMVFTGFGMMQLMASCNTILQTIADEDKRGRVMSYFTMALIGTAPFGSLAAGVLADRFGAPEVIASGGAICLVGAVWFGTRLSRLRPLVRPIYERMGILPMAEGAREASIIKDGLGR